MRLVGEVVGLVGEIGSRPDYLGSRWSLPQHGEPSGQLVRSLVGGRDGSTVDEMDVHAWPYQWLERRRPSPSPPPTHLS